MSLDPDEDSEPTEERAFQTERSSIAKLSGILHGWKSSKPSGHNIPWGMLLSPFVRSMHTTFSNDCKCANLMKLTVVSTVIVLIRSGDSADNDLFPVFI